MYQINSPLATSLTLHFFQAPPHEQLEQAFKMGHNHLNMLSELSAIHSSLRKDANLTRSVLECEVTAALLKATVRHLQQIELTPTYIQERVLPLLDSIAREATVWILRHGSSQMVLRELDTLTDHMSCFHPAYN
jgi:hypothetical protein